MAAFAGVDVGMKTSTIIDEMAKIEALGEEILTDKHQLVDLNRKKNGIREAISSLKKKSDDGVKSWLCIGSMFFKLEDNMIKNTLHQDQKELDKEITTVRDGLTEKVSELHKLEGQKDVNGFSLTSLSTEDLSYVKGDI